MDLEEQAFGGNYKKVMMFIHFFGWMTQFVGHFVYEQRAPALLTNVFFIFMAPFFSTFEVVNYLTGYRQKDVEVYNVIIEQDIAHYRLQKGIK